MKSELNVTFTKPLHVKLETVPPAALSEINHKLDHIMSKISDFADKQTAHNDAIDTAVAGLQGDIKALNDKIAELQNTSGTISPEDQALLDGIEARSSAIATKIAALDALTPPAVPVA
jgi:predicted  nucleic acid-binding Zn-ribbon protein